MNFNAIRSFRSASPSKDPDLAHSWRGGRGALDGAGGGALLHWPGHGLGLRRPARLQIGFAPHSEGLYRAYNFSIALALILLVLPLGLMIAALLLATQGRPIFYRGARMGRGHTRFDILKFRTLDSHRAAVLTRDRVLPPGSGLETPLGLFLRETRLDELPQLFNVLRGDMNMCGPRPVRAEIAALNAAEIPDYGTRFQVKPGMIGPAQAFMSHGTSKAIRSRLNNRICRAAVSYRGEAYLVFIVAACVLARTGARLLRLIGEALPPAARRRASVDAPNGALRFVEPGGAERAVAHLDETAIALHDAQTAPACGEGQLVLTLPGGQARRVAIEIDHSAQPVAPCGEALAYRAKSDFGEHILSRYFFQKVVVPHRSEFLAARLGRALRRRAARGR